MATTGDLDRFVKNAIKKIQREVKRKRLAAPKKKHSIRDYPAIVVACGWTGSKRIFEGRSGMPINVTWVRDIKSRLSALGDIGTLKNGNPIGACAEPKAANKVVKEFQCQMDELQFSDAYRPRTCKRKRYCKNCKATFCEVL